MIGLWIVMRALIFLLLAHLFCKVFLKQSLWEAIGLSSKQKLRARPKDPEHKGPTIEIESEVVEDAPQAADSKTQDLMPRR